MATKQNFKATFFDSTNGLGAHKGQRRTHTHTHGHTDGQTDVLVEIVC